MAYQARLFTRFRTKLPVMVRPIGKFSWTRATMMNLSQGGLLLQSHDILNVKSDIEIEFNTTDRMGKKNRRRLRAHIVWRRGTRYGLRFLKNKKKRTA